MFKECRVYARPDVSYRIFPPDLVNFEQHTLFFVYNDTLINRVKAWVTKRQMKTHGNITCQISALPYIDYRRGGSQPSLITVSSLHIGRVTTSVHLEKKYRRNQDEELGGQT